MLYFIVITFLYLEYTFLMIHNMDATYNNAKQNNENKKHQIAHIEY